MIAATACTSVDERSDARKVASSVAASATPFALVTESRANPIDVGRTTPRLSWKSAVGSQAAYEIEVASSPNLLASGQADLWDSGMVADGRSVAIPYAGSDLGSRDGAYWRVRIWAQGADTPGSWSDTASWRMALLDGSDWTAKWLTAPDFAAAETSDGMERWLTATAADPQFRNRDHVAKTLEILRDVRPAAYFRKGFTITKPVASAHLYSTSAGYSEFYLSGEKIGDRVLNPAQTDYDKRIYYDVDDLAARLTPGEHVLAAHLGNGFYGERTAFGLKKLFYGEPAIIAQLEIRYQDGTRQTIVSDGSWRASPSPILKNGVYSGEVFDARKQVAGWSGDAKVLEADAWVPAAVMAQAPTQQLVAAEMPPTRRKTELSPKAIYNPAPGVWTIDFGQNLTGLPNVDVAKLGLKEGQTVVFRYAEWADEAGNVGMNSGGGAPRTKQVDAYMSDGIDAAAWSPSFTWHGFRYMEVTGVDAAPPIEALSAHLTRTDIDRVGRFSSSSDLLNRIHDTALWSFETNLISVPSDCPIRERNGWTGDAHATVRMASYNYAMSPFLDKYLGDFITTDQIAPTIVPGRRTRSGMIDWAAAEVFLTWEHYLHSGDQSVIELQYDSMIEYVDYVETVADGDLFTDKKHHYGDWCDTLPELGMERPLGRCASFSTPVEITTGALMMRVFDQMADMAQLLGKESDAARFAARRDAIQNAFNNAYLDRSTGDYGSQTANAMALSFGIVPEGRERIVAAALEKDVRVKWEGHASVGALGQTWLYPALGDYGHGDTAFRIFTADGPPGYRYLFDTLNGTTLWEDITHFESGKGGQPGRSLNHPFKGGYDAWFYSGLGGINPVAESPGFKHFELRPVFPADLEESRVSLDTGYGTIRSDWSRSGDTIEWTFDVPANTTATVRLGSIDAAGRLIRPGTHRIVLDASGTKELRSQ